MNLVIEPRDNILLNLQCNEIINKDIITDLIDTDLLRTHQNNEYNSRLCQIERDMLYKYIKLIKNNKAKVVYKRQINYGRVIPDKALSLFCFRKEIRHSLCKDNYIDIDVVCCHNVILEQLCKHNNINCEYLTKYINNRDSIIIDIIKQYNIKDNEDKTPRDIVKTLFITLIYGGTFQWFLKKNNINYDDIKQHDITNFIEEYETELNNIKNHIIKLNPNLVNEIKQQKLKQKIKKYNLINTSFSIYLQDFENKILEHIYIYCKDNKYINKNDCILTYDGIMINKKYFKQTLLNELEQYIYTKLNFKIKLITKEMDSALTHDYIKSKKIDRLNFCISSD